MRWLHGQQAGWRLVGSSVPPRLTGMMWSMVVAVRWWQIAQVGLLARMRARVRPHARLVLRPCVWRRWSVQYALRVSVGHPGWLQTVSGRTWATP